MDELFDSEYLYIAQRALCADVGPDMFFPEVVSSPVGPNKDDYERETAHKVCHFCEVRQECLEYALNNRIDHGVWGGMTEQERARIIKHRRRGDPLEMVM